MMKLSLGKQFSGLMNKGRNQVMDITMGQPFAVSERGGRLNNEDSVYPQPEVSSAKHHLFIICDGVGGAEKGEIASALACESIQTYFDTFLQGNPTEAFISQAIRYTETRFDDYISANPSAKGMATTLAMLYVGSNGITVAHIGDSRIYQFRKGKILHETEDHSLVNSLIKLGRIKPEEVSSHPQKNVILKAISGTEYPVQADVTLLTDIRPGDNLFICSDGVIECFDDISLSKLFEKDLSPDMLKSEVLDACINIAHDNFSFYIIPVNNVQETISVKHFILSFLYSFI